MKILDKPSPNYDERQYRKIKYIIIHYTGMISSQASLRRLRDKKVRLAAIILLMRKVH